MRRVVRAVLGVLVLLALGAILMGGLLLLGGAGAPRSVTLKNGVTLRCLGVSYGTNHVVYTGSAAAQMLHRVLSAVFPSLRRGASSSQRYTTSQPALVVALRQEGTATTNPMPPLSVTALLADERGVTAGKRHWLTLGGGTSFTLWLDAEVLPRRSRLLSVRFFGLASPGAIDPLGELEILNPAFTNPPPLVAANLPVLGTNGDLECSLEALAFGTGISSGRTANADGTETISEAPAEPGQEVRATALFRFREAGTNTAFWTIGSLSSIDATGNTGKAGSYGSQTLGDAFLLTFGPVPWPDEPWRLDCWAKRTAAAPFAPDELIELRGVELPPSGRTNQLDHATKAGGLDVLVKGFVRRDPVQRGSYSSTDLSRLLLELPQLPDGAFIDLVRVEDDQGRLITSEMTSTTHGTPLRTEFGFRAIPDDARTLNITLAVQRGRAFTFVAQAQKVEADGFKLTIPKLEPPVRTR